MFSSLLVSTAGIHPALAAAFLFPLLTLSPEFVFAQAAPPRTIGDITSLLDQYKPDPIKIAALKENLAADPLKTGSKSELGQFHLQRARAKRRLGMAEEAAAEYRKALELGPAQGRQHNRIIEELAGAEDTVGNNRTAIETMRELTLVKEEDWRFVGRIHLALLFSFAGDIRSAREEFKQAEAAFATLRNHSLASRFFATSWTSLLEKARAHLYLLEGKFEDAVISFRKALAAQSGAVENVDNLLDRATYTGSRVGTEQARDNIERWLARAEMRRGRLSEAELHFRNILKNLLTRSGKYHPVTGQITRDFADLLVAQGRYSEAVEMAKISLEIFSVSGVPPSSSYPLGAHKIYARALVAQERWTEAVAEYETVRKIKVQTDKSGKGGQGERDWALALARTGEVAQGVAMLESLVRTNTERMGAGHYETAELRGYLGIALALAGDKERALDEFRESIRMLLETDATGSDESGSYARTQRLTWIIKAYIGLLYDIRNSEIVRRRGINPAEESFRLADAARGQSVQRALAASAARSAVSDPGLAELVRQEQDLGNQLPLLYGYLLNSLSTPPEQQLPKVITDMRARIADIDKERRLIADKVRQRFPAYANLVNPKPASLEDARKALQPGEALLSFLVTGDRTYVWAVNRTNTAFAVSKLSETELRQKISHLRKSLDPGQTIRGVIPEFDTDTAYDLYAELLKPTADTWRDATTLLVAANGSLAEIPLALLVTDRHTLSKDPTLSYAGYRAVPWLARKTAVVQLPSVNSLLTLRDLPTANRARAAFVGFGDPQFSRQQNSIVAGPGGAVQMRNLSIRRSDGNGRTAEWLEYARLEPLPDTRDEILAIAAALKADPRKDVYLGADASKQKLKSIELRDRKVIAFATHGLMAGDFPGLDEPALALAIPPGEQETGLLTLSEILSLKLDADWVVLSACNTAAGEGAGAEAVSGLGRGFFYAGSRSLLVTHWPVETRSARMLVTGIFERYANDGKITRAEALRQSMLSVMDANYIDPATQKPAFAYAHPIFWAPYAIVGDGGAH